MDQIEGAPPPPPGAYDYPENVVPLKPPPVTRLREEPELPRPTLVNNDAEQALLGALLIVNRAYDSIWETLTPDDFGYPVHGRIYEAIGRILENGGEANPVTLKDQFEGDEAWGLAPDAGPRYLMQLARCAVTVSNVPYYAEIIIDRARRRQMIECCEGTIVECNKVELDKPVLKIIEQHESLVFELQGQKLGVGGLENASQASTSGINSIEESYKYKGALRGPTTGLCDLDDALGGLRPGELHILAARPSMGKTALALQMFLAAAAAGTPGIMFSLEMATDQLAVRALSAKADIPGMAIRRGDLNQPQWQRLMEAKEWLACLPVWFDETSALSLLQVEQRARRAKRRHNVGLIVVDYLQLMPGNRRDGNRRLEIEYISGGLKRLAKELEVPVLALSQLSRALESREEKRPQLSDLRESGSIEQDAATVMFIFREEYYLREELPRKEGEANDKFDKRRIAHEEHRDKVKNLAEIIVGKNRHGKSPETIRAFWDAGYTRFRSLVRYPT